MQNTNTRKYIFMGLLVGLAIVFTRFVQIPVSLPFGFSDRVSLGFLPVAIAGSLFGTFGGALVGGIEDLIRAIIFPQGAFNPLFTANAALRGAVYGLTLKKMNFTNVLIASIIVFLLNNTLIISAIISFFYGQPFSAAIVSKLPVSALNCVVQVLVLSLAGIPIERKLSYVRK